MNKLNFKENQERYLFLYRYIRGSTLYGTNIEGSDVDQGGVYLSPLEHIIGLGFDYQDEIKDERGDLSYYELNKYLHLLIKSNPNVLESLYIPEKFVIGKIHPLIQKILSNKEQFLTKKCFEPFLGYAYNQIKKARGLNKKIFNPIVERKDILDFCYTFYEQGSSNIKNWLENRGLKQNYIGLVNIPNMHNMYAAFYDWGNHFLHEGYENIPISLYYDDISLENFEYYSPIGYKGIINEDRNSNEVRLSSIPKGEKPICYLSFNKDGYTAHCKDYKEFKEWEEKRNPLRYESTIKLGKGMDVKNMMHCIRLMHMAKEMATGEGFNIVRTWDKEMLMNIRLGKIDYDYLIDYAEKLKIEIEKAIPLCTLPETININFVNDLLIEIRKEQLKY